MYHAKSPTVAQKKAEILPVTKRKKNHNGPMFKYFDSKIPKFTAHAVKYINFWLSEFFTFYN